MNHGPFGSGRTRGWMVAALAVVALAVAWWIVASSRTPGEPTLQSIRIGEAGTVELALIYIADGMGFFEDEGVDVELVRYASGRDAIAGALNGEVELATPYDGPVVLNANRGEPIRVLTVLAFAPDNTRLLIRASSGIDDPSGLRGKRVGIVENSNPVYLLSLLLRDVGMDLADVETVPMSPPETVTAILDGDVDAISIWAPYWQQVRDALGADAIATYTSPIYVESAFLATTRDVLEERADAIQRVLRALIRAEVHLITNPEEALELVVARLSDKVSAEIVREQWGTVEFAVRLDQRTFVSLESQATWFAEVARFGDAPDDLSVIFSPGPLRSVAPLRVTYGAGGP